MSANDDVMSHCAACGKGGDGLRTCAACKMVKYCGAGCEEDHRAEHEEECRKRAAELFDEKLFEDPPPREECPICFLPLPLKNFQIIYQSCCGKLICRGCMIAVEENEEDWAPCPFCRREPPDDEEQIRRVTKRMEANDGDALLNFGHYYQNGEHGLPQDSNKAVELWSKGAELGSAMCCSELGAAYYMGQVVEKNVKKCIHYWQLGAMGGSMNSRYNLGAMEKEAGNMDRAVKHWMIAARAGGDDSLKAVKDGYVKGYVTKDDFTNALRAHQKSNDEMRSDNRDRAAKILADEAKELRTASKTKH